MRSVRAISGLPDRENRVKDLSQGRWLDGDNARWSWKCGGESADVVNRDGTDRAERLGKNQIGLERSKERSIEFIEGSPAATRSRTVASISA